MAARLENWPLAMAINEKPSEVDLDLVSKRAGAKSRSLLTHLGVPSTKCEALNMECLGKPVDACFKGLLFWREGNKPCKPPTWSVLLEALEIGAEMRDYAEEIRADLAVHGHIQPDVSSEGNPLTLSMAQGVQVVSMAQGVQVVDISQKVNVIITNYKNGKTNISLPRNPKLENDLNIILVKVRKEISSATPETIKDLKLTLQRNHRSYSEGVKTTSLQNVPDTVDGLIEFISVNTTHYEVFLVRDTIGTLNNGQLQAEWGDYESKLAKHLREKLVSFKDRHITLRLRQNHAHMAVVTKEQVLLSVVLHLKEYFRDYLGLENALFEGFEEGCIVLYFSIQEADAKALYDKSSLKSFTKVFLDLKLYSVTAIILFGYFSWDADKGFTDLSGNGTLESENQTGGACAADCRSNLRMRMQQYSQATLSLVQHRDTGYDYLQEAADDLDKAFKIVAGAKIAGSSMGVVAGVLGVVGGGLLLGGVTAPAGIALLAVGGAFGVGAGVIGVGATIGDGVKNRKALRQANDWIRQGSDLSRELIVRFEAYREELVRITQTYGVTEADALQLAMGDSFRDFRADLTVEDFQGADNEAEIAIQEWKTALEAGAQVVANSTIAGMQIGGAVARGVIVGGEAGAEAGATVARVALQGVGGAVVGLSAVFIVVDLALISKTAYDIHKNAGGTKLAKTLRAAAVDMKAEMDKFRPLAEFTEHL